MAVAGGPSAAFSPALLRDPFHRLWVACYISAASVACCGICPQRVVSRVVPRASCCRGEGAGDSAAAVGALTFKSIAVPQTGCGSALEGLWAGLPAQSCCCHSAARSQALGQLPAHQAALQTTLFKLTGPVTSSGSPLSHQFAQWLHLHRAFALLRELGREGSFPKRLD